MNAALNGSAYPKHRLALGIALGLATSLYLQGCATIQSTAEEDPIMLCGMGPMVTGAASAGCPYLLNGSTTSLSAQSRRQLPTA